MMASHRTTKKLSRRSWKLERASVHRAGARRPRSNKYSGGDVGSKPRDHARKGAWVGGYRRRDGRRVKGYYRTSAQYWWRR
ncbi:MAG: hypothetical protein HY372_03340 [Candidatus Andersenbacteria bacterium]|nr:hypothetical protein [Candidatus Andersenbacteria bacterium]